MRAIIKSGKELLFLEGESGKNLLGLKDELILNFMSKWTVRSVVFALGDLKVSTTEGLVVIRFSSPVQNVITKQYEKDQLILKLIKT